MAAKPILAICVEPKGSGEDRRLGVLGALMMLQKQLQEAAPDDPQLLKLIAGDAPLYVFVSETPPV